MSEQRQDEYITCPYTRSDCPLFNPTFPQDEARHYGTYSPSWQQPSNGSGQAAVQNDLDDLSPIHYPSHIPSPAWSTPLPPLSPLEPWITSQLLPSQAEAPSRVDAQACYDRHQQAYEASDSPPSRSEVQDNFPVLASSSFMHAEQDLGDLLHQSVLDANPGVQAASTTSTGTVTVAATVTTRAGRPTPFISKLFHLMSQGEYSDVISWSPDGRSVVFQHSSDGLLARLRRLFNHSNIHSLVRQLNIYNFKRLDMVDLLRIVDHPPFDIAPASSWAAFAHPSFFKDATDLQSLKPKTSQPLARTRSAKRGRKDSASGEPDTKRRKSSSETDGNDLPHD